MSFVNNIHKFATTLHSRITFHLSGTNKIPITGLKLHSKAHQVDNMSECPWRYVSNKAVNITTGNIVGIINVIYIERGSTRIYFFILSCGLWLWSWGYKMVQNQRAFCQIGEVSVRFYQLPDTKNKFQLSLIILSLVYNPLMMRTFLSM